MNKRTTKNFQPEPQSSSEQKADEMHVSPAIANANVICRSQLDYRSNPFHHYLSLIGLEKILLHNCALQNLTDNTPLQIDERIDCLSAKSNELAVHNVSEYPSALKSCNLKLEPSLKANLFLNVPKSQADLLDYFDLMNCIGLSTPSILFGRLEKQYLFGLDHLRSRNVSGYPEVKKVSKKGLVWHYIYFVRCQVYDLFQPPLLDWFLSSKRLLLKLKGLLTSKKFQNNLWLSLCVSFIFNGI